MHNFRSLCANFNPEGWGIDTRLMQPFKAHKMEGPRISTVKSAAFLHWFFQNSFRCWVGLKRVTSWQISGFLKAWDCVWGCNIHNWSLYGEIHVKKDVFFNKDCYLPARYAGMSGIEHSSLVGLRLVALAYPRNCSLKFSSPTKNHFGIWWLFRHQLVALADEKPWGCATKTEVLWCC